MRLRYAVQPPITAIAGCCACAASGHAARMRRHRKRQATGRLSITTDFTQEETAKLCRLRYLTDSELEDRNRIAEAVHALIANIRTKLHPNDPPLVVIVLDTLNRSIRAAKAATRT